MSVRRLRHQVLASVDATRLERAKPTYRWLQTVAAAAAAAVAVGLVLEVGFRREAPPLRPATPTAQPSRTTVEIVPAPGARFTRTTGTTEERVDLTEGSLHFVVGRAIGGSRVIVHVPDGEIEDIGTVFDVTVRADHTERVMVQQGRVLVNVGGGAAFTVVAGGSWERPAATLDDRPALVPTFVPPRKPSTPTAIPRGAPANGEAEDAAYLAVLRLVRQGREDEARAAATTYLHAFPNGFRREEMSRVAHE